VLVDHTETHIDTLTETFTLPDFASVLPMMAAMHTTPIRQSTLIKLHNELVEPFLSGVAQGIETDTVRAKVAATDSVEAAVAFRMLTYGYCSHYFTGTGDPQLPEEPNSPQFQQYTLMAICGDSHTPLILGTLQAIVGDTVPALKLFAPAPGGTLPHRAAVPSKATYGLIGELRRFSINPLLESIPLLPDDPLNVMLRGYRSVIYRGLYELSLHIFHALNIHFAYGIATPEIYRFFTRSSMIMSPLEGMRLAENDEVRTLQQNFTRYWRPQAPREQQPALYRIHLPAHSATSSTD
jgi:hypothetical protein